MKALFFDSDNESQLSAKSSIKDVPWHEKHKISETVANDPDQGTYRKVPVADFGKKVLKQN